MFRFTLRKSLLSVIIIIGLSGIVALIVNSRNFVDIAYEFQAQSTNRIIHNNITNALEELKRLTSKMGFDLQREDAFVEAFHDNDIAAIQHSFDDQFAQYYTTANILSLQKIYIFDNELNLMTMSTRGFSIDKDDPIICKEILNDALPRQGAERSKKIEELCIYKQTAFHGTLLPVGLIPRAYIMIVTDPSFSMKKLENSLGSSIQISHPSGEVAYQSPQWPESGLLDDYLIVDHRHSIDHNKPKILGQAINWAFTITVAESTSTFANKIQNSVNMSTLISGGFFVVALLGAIIILNLTLRPLNRLQTAAKEFRKGTKEPLKETGFAEIEDVTRAYNSLVSHVSELIEQLEESRNKEQHANLAKSHFLANMSHELRTPLSSIIGFSEMLREEEFPETQRNHYLDTIINSGNHLQQLISDILDMSKVEAGKLEIEKTTFDLKELLRDVSSIMSINAKQKNVEFETTICNPVPRYINSDPLRIRQILINLCGNAFKFTEHGKVTIELEYFDEVNKLVFRIKDTGTGIQQADIDKLFRPFQQATTSLPKKYAGTGLGLALSKQFVQLLGGDISVTSEPGFGSTFTFNINTGKSDSIELINDLDEDANKENNDRPPPLLQRLCGKVLVAEDNATLQSLIKAQLSHTRADVTLANNGLEAIKLASQFEFDLILMDMQMPMMDGVQATQELRKLGIKTPIYALTANVMVEEKQRYMAIGCDGYLAKPIIKKQLYDTLVKCLPLVNTRVVDARAEFVAPEDLDSIMTLFKESIPETKRKLHRLKDSPDLVEVREILHEIKAVTGSLNFQKLARMATELELAARDKNNEAVIPRIPLLIDELDKVLKDINERQQSN